MCNTCHYHICPSACPEYTRRAAGVCACCGGLIYDSEPRMRESEGRLFHAECLESLKPGELLSLFGIDLFEEE